MTVFHAPFELRIGPLRFLVEPPEGIAVSEIVPTYREFLLPAPGPGEMPKPAAAGELVLPVELRLDGAPDVADLPILFDTESTWSAHEADGALLLRLRTEGPGDPHLWLARLPEAPGLGSPTVVHAGSRLVERGADGGVTELHNPLHYPLDQLLAMLVLAGRDGIVCHAAGIVVDGRGVILAGRSGAGKTTISRLVAQRPEILGLSDDRLILTVDGASPRAHGTPWAGEGQIAANRSAEAAALVFLHHAPADELRPISPAAALEQLLPVASVPWFDAGRMSAALTTCGRLVEEMPAYELHFRPEPSAVDLLLESL